MCKKTHVVFFVFHLVQLYIFTLWMPWSMFRWNISLSTNLLFLKSGVCVCTSLLTMLLASNQFPTQLYFTLPQIHSSSIIIRPLGLFHLEFKLLTRNRRCKQTPLCLYCPEIRGLYLMKWPTKILQNLPYCWNMKTYIRILFFISSYFIFFPNLMSTRAFIRGKK